MYVDLETLSRHRTLNMSLTDEQWPLIRPLLSPSSPASRGRPPADPRAVLDAVLWKIRSDTPWYDFPADLPPWQTCYRYYHRWLRDGVLDEIAAALYRDLRDRGGLDLAEIVKVSTLRLERSGRFRLTPPPDFQSDGGDWRSETVSLLMALLELVVRRNSASSSKN